MGIDFLLGTRCQYITFLDSDDFLHPSVLSMMIEVANNASNKSIVACYVKPVYGSELPEYYSNDVIQEYEVEDFYCKRTIDCIHLFGKLYPINDFDLIRLPKGVRFAEDTLTTYRIVFNHDNVVYINKPLYGYYQSNESLVRSAWIPAKYNAVIGFEQQLDFFIKKGLYEAVDVCKRHYFHTVVLNISEAKAAGFEYLYMIHNLRKTINTHKKYFTVSDKIKIYTKIISIVTGLYPFIVSMNNCLRQHI